MCNSIASEDNLEWGWNEEVNAVTGTKRVQNKVWLGGKFDPLRIGWEIKI